VQYAVGFAVTDKFRAAISKIPRRVWIPAFDVDGKPREADEAAVAELTGLLDLQLGVSLGDDRHVLPRLRSLT
jgi:hypothetical protein